ncbi:MAG: hypothetical protein ABJC89_26570, partial [Acidobacteriota bacterium]
QGAGLRFLTGPITSPSLAEIMATILRDLPQAKWHQYDPVARDARVGGTPGGATAGAPIYHFDKADVVLTLDSDFLACGPGSVRYQKDFAARRRVTTERREMNRLYAIESTPSLTGTKADHRLVLKAGEIEGFARQLAAGLGAGRAGAAGSPAPSGTADTARWVAAVAKDLQASRGTSVVVAGEYQPAAVHDLARAMNQALGNVGTTVTYGGSIDAAPAAVGSLTELVAAMNAGQVEVLVMLGGNPVYSAPADLKFQEALEKVNLRIYHGLYADETAFLCHWTVADTHPLESWGDARAYDGTVTIIQPLIAPLYDGRSAHEVLGAFTSQSDRRTLAVVKEYWTRAFAGGSGWTIRTADGQAFKDVETFWRHALHDGFIRGTGMADGGPATPFVAAPAAAAASGAAAGAGVASAPAPAPANTLANPNPPAPPAAPTAAPAAGAAAQAPAPPPAPASPGGLEIIFRPDPTIWDGRFANNGWLQELPKPLTKVTWDTTAWISPQLATERGLSDGDVIELKYRGNTAYLPVVRVPGHPAQSVTVFLGYGRRMAGGVGTATKEAQRFNAYLLRTSDAPWFGSGLEITRTGERYLLATTQ